MPSCGRRSAGAGADGLSRSRYGASAAGALAGRPPRAVRAGGRRRGLHPAVRLAVRLSARRSAACQRSASGPRLLLRSRSGAGLPLRLCRAARHCSRALGETPQHPRWGALRVRKVALLGLQPPTARGLRSLRVAPHLRPLRPRPPRAVPVLASSRGAASVCCARRPRPVCPQGRPGGKTPGADRERSPSAPLCWQGLRKEPAEKAPAGSPCQRALRGSGEGVGSGGMSVAPVPPEACRGQRQAASVALPLVAAARAAGRYATGSAGAAPAGASSARWGERGSGLSSSLSPTR